MPYRSREDYNENKREYMRKYRANKRGLTVNTVTSAQSQSSLSPLIPVHSPVPAQKPRSRNLPASPPVRKAIFETICEQEEVELMRHKIEEKTSGWVGYSSLEYRRNLFDRLCKRVVQEIEDSPGNEIDQLIHGLRLEAKKLEFLAKYHPFVLATAARVLADEKVSYSLEGYSSNKGMLEDPLVENLEEIENRVPTFLDEVLKNHAWDERPKLTIQQGLMIIDVMNKINKH